MNRDPDFLNGCRQAIQRARASGTWWVILLASEEAIGWGVALQGRYDVEAAADELGVLLIPTPWGPPQDCVGVLVAHKRYCSAIAMATALSPGSPVPLELVEEPGALLVPSLAPAEADRVLGWFEAWLAGEENPDA